MLQKLLLLLKTEAGSIDHEIIQLTNFKSSVVLLML